MPDTGADCFLNSGKKMESLQWSSDRYSPLSQRVHVCATCSDNFIVNTKFTKCDWCKGSLRTNWAKLKYQFIKLRQECNNIKWQRVFTPNDNLNLKTKEVLEKTEELINLFHQQQKHQKPTFSKIVKNNGEKTEDELGQEYEVRTGKLWRPKIKIINVQDEDLINEEQFVANIAKQNLPDIMRNDIKFVRKYKTAKNKKNTFDVILEVSADQYNYISNKKDSLFVHWHKYRYSDSICVLRCLQCWKYGHRAINALQNRFVRCATKTTRKRRLYKQ
ncbi:hypothetical protein HHI36_019935 [Cryptolaemus montrouzieri]|uniref:Uncharacterized protein n=1 Tax=Cryptolaemus montrouzieri TaxID=559131 RepID=A0ABD2N9V1_9CUCU